MRHPLFSGSFLSRLRTGAALGLCLSALAACQTPSPATATPTEQPNTSAPSQAAQAVSPEVKSRTPVIGMANPASVHCQKAGGTLEIRQGTKGAYGICHMPDGRMCEEWSFFRTGKCSAESLKNS
ncbi:putative hemolysin [Acetobacter senegalensis]|uniref:putative hemolysin n=1 Tax=Acetobacter senegalensis TaxID=446692 RepID=UPI001EDA9782|nr:DUF333 domain-containing protein [Acetobacter senegalensis]